MSQVLSLRTYAQTEHVCIVCRWSRSEDRPITASAPCTLPLTRSGRTCSWPRALQQVSHLGAPPALQWVRSPLQCQSRSQESDSRSSRLCLSSVRLTGPTSFKGLLRVSHVIHLGVSGLRFLLKCLVPSCAEGSGLVLKSCFMALLRHRGVTGTRETKSQGADELVDVWVEERPDIIMEIQKAF